MITRVCWTCVNVGLNFDESSKILCLQAGREEGDCRRCSVVLQLGPQWARRSGLSRQALVNLEDGLLCDE